MTFSKTFLFLNSCGTQGEIVEANIQTIRSRNVGLWAGFGDFRKSQEKKEVYIITGIQLLV